MRVAAIADIHSNLHALRAVLDEVDRRGMDLLVCAGDTVGYGPFPNECCREVKHAADRIIAGNHDLSALTRDVGGMNPYAAEAALWTADALDAESSSLLKSLDGSARFEFAGKSFAVFHGSPRDPVEYVFEEDVREDTVEGVTQDFLILGHTHVPFVRRVGSVTVVNPGSVGQPRDGNPRASFAIIDTSASEVDIVRKPYDAGVAAEAIAEKGLPKALGERLLAGR